MSGSSGELREGTGQLLELASNGQHLPASDSSFSDSGGDEAKSPSSSPSLRDAGPLRGGEPLGPGGVSG